MSNLMPGLPELSAVVIDVALTDGPSLAPIVPAVSVALADGSAVVGTVVIPGSLPASPESRPSEPPPHADTSPAVIASAAVGATSVRNVVFTMSTDPRQQQ